MNNRFGNARSTMIPFMNKFDLFEKEMNDLFNNSFFKDSFSMHRGRAHCLPKVNIKEEEDNYIVEMSIPGWDRKDISIEVFENKIEISGSRNKEISEEEDKYIFKEIGQRNFNRIIPLPKKINTKKIDSDFINGIVYLKLQKQELEKREKGIKVEI